MSPVGECLEKEGAPRVFGHCPSPPIPNTCLPLLCAGSWWLLRVISAFPGESSPWNLKVLHGHCSVFLREDLGARLMEQGWPPKPVPAPLCASFCSRG